MSESPRFIIGIDLGTTNCAVAYLDQNLQVNPRQQLQLFKIPQLVEEGVINELPLLSSTIYQVGPYEGSPELFQLPWQKNKPQPTNDLFCVGFLAKSKGSLVPSRLIESAKSWLCTADGFRREKILPLDAAEPDRRLSAVDALSLILKHIKDAWNSRFAKSLPTSTFENQHIILTLPASFDEYARTLTLQACKKAEYRELTLLEEPQAAFYCWINDNEKAFKEKIFHQDRILVCDIGGGTTDFSLIDVEISQSVNFKRVAVGNHLLLGGDNMDQALTAFYEQKLIEAGNPPLNANTWTLLKQQLKSAKEKLLKDGAPSETSIWISGRGSKIIGEGFTLTIKRDDILTFLKEGFFPLLPLDIALIKNTQSALITNGLPYEREAIITKQLAWFLKQNNCFEPGQYPTAILFNGGTLLPGQFQNLLVEALNLWSPSKNAIRVLKSSHLEHAVAFGAAYFGKAKLGHGIRISSGLPRSYFLKLSQEGDSAKALTLLSKGAEEGTSYESTASLYALTNSPVSFEIISSLNLSPPSGEVLTLKNEEISALPALYTILKYGKESSHEKIPVSLKITYTELGTLKLWLKSVKTDHLWNLEFQLKSVGGQENILNNAQSSIGESFSEDMINKCISTLQEAFQQKVASEVMKRLESIIGKPRYEWPLSLIRSLFDELIQLAELRKKSKESELRWWNLAGFLLRPGLGYALDDHRVSKLWKVLLSENKKLHSDDLTIQLWICYRRIAAGLNKGQQLQLFHELFTQLQSKAKILSDNYRVSENLRTLATFELIDPSNKIKLGEHLLKSIKSTNATDAMVWALARVGSRKPLYSGLGSMVPKNVCEEWLIKLLSFQKIDENQMIPIFAAFSTPHPERYLNIDEKILHQVTQRLESKNLLGEFQKALKDLQNTSNELSRDQWGESLPPGLELS